MATIKEAIDLVRTAFGAWENEYARRNGRTEMRKARDLAVDALKKQDPMVPDVYGDGYADGLPVYDMWDCPACGTSYEIEGEQHEYCPHCGQRINWEGYKEECESM